MVGGVAFYQRREVKDVLAYLRVVVNPNDDDSVLRIINVPNRGIGETTVARIRAFASTAGVPVYEALRRVEEIADMTPRGAEAVRAFRALIDRYRGLQGALSASETARMIVDEAGFLRVLKEEGTLEASERRDNILEVLAAVTQFCEALPEARLEDFLAEAVLATGADQKQAGNAVSLMTLHAAKGLEFPVVVIAGCDDGLVPLGYGQEPDVLEEERRLFYVGMTRAQRRFVLQGAASRFQYGERNEMRASRFLSDITGLESVEELSRAGHAAPRVPHVTVPNLPTRAPSIRRAGSAPVRRAPSAPAPSSTGGGHLFSVGMVVMHETFGAGRILQLSGAGDDAHAIVEFRTAGRKRLMLKYANLKKA